MTTKIPVELSSTPGIVDSSNATAITIDSDERIIIGHTTALDDIRATDPYLQVLGSGLDTAHIGVIRFSDSVNGGHISIGKSRSGTVGTNTIVQNGDKIGSLNFVGADGSDYHEGAVIEAVVSGTPGSTDLPTALTFQTTADGASTSTERMRIQSDGGLKLTGGDTSGIQDLIFNNGGLTINYQSSYTLSGIVNTGALIAIGQQRSSLGVTYDHCLLFAEGGTDLVTLADPSSRFAINSNNTSNKTNIYISGGDVVIMNEVGTNQPYTIAVFKFQGN
jgi:hypothetical protein